MARQARGSKTALLLTPETVYGVTPAAPEKAWRLPFNTNELAGKHQFIESNTITGRRDHIEPAMGQVDANGSIAMPLDTRNIGVMLTAMFGNLETTGTDAPYTHLWKVKDDMPSVSIEKTISDTGSYIVYPGCKVSTFSMDTTVGNNETIYTAEILGADEVVNDTTLEESPIKLPIARYNNFQATVFEGDEVLATCRSLNFTIDFGLDGETWCLNGKPTRTDINEGIVRASGEMVLLFKDTALIEKAKAGINTSLRLIYTNGIDSLEFLFPEVKLISTETTPVIPGPAGLLLNMGFQAFFNGNAEDSSIVVTMVNDVDSYGF